MKAFALATSICLFGIMAQAARFDIPSSTCINRITWVQAELAKRYMAEGETLAREVNSQTWGEGEDAKSPLTVGGNAPVQTASGRIFVLLLDVKVLLLENNDCRVLAAEAKPYAGQ